MNLLSSKSYHTVPILLLNQQKWINLQGKVIYCPSKIGLFFLKNYFTLSRRNWRTVLMLFMLGLFVTCGDPSSPFLLAYYVQVILSSFSMYDRKFKGVHAPSCTVEKFSMFFFRLRAPAAGVDGLPFKFFAGGINQDMSEDHMERRSPFQCSVKVKILGSEPTLLNVLDCQILPMGYQFRMVGWDRNSHNTSFRDVAFLPLDKEGGKEFVVLMGYARHLLVLRSSEMRWMRLEETSRADCMDIVTFRGKFYVTFVNGDIRVIDPYSLTASPLYPLELAPLMPLESLKSTKYLVPVPDELYLVERILVCSAEVFDLSNIACRVSRLDEDAGEWVEVTDLGDRVLLIGQQRNSSCLGKELPDCCGLSGNSFLFINEYVTEYVGKTYYYKYGVDTGNAEDNLNL